MSQVVQSQQSSEEVEEKEIQEYHYETHSGQGQDDVEEFWSDYCKEHDLNPRTGEHN